MYTYNGSHYPTRYQALVAACRDWLGVDTVERSPGAEALAGAMIASRYAAGAIRYAGDLQPVAYSRDEYTHAMADALHVLGKVK